MDENKKEKTQTKLVRKIVEKLPKGKALEIGPGLGRETNLLLENGWQVEAIDINQDNLDRIYDSLPDELKMNFFAKQGDVNDIILEKECYDLVIGYFSLFYCTKENITQMMEKIKNSLKKGGTFSGNLLGSNDEWKENYNNKMYFTKEEIVKFLKQYFEFDENDPEEFFEREYDGHLYNGDSKHWHLYYFKVNNFRLKDKLQECEENYEK